MNSINLAGEHITFERETIQAAPDRFNLLADIPSSITVSPRSFVRVPAPIVVSGDGSTVFLMLVHAGRVPGDSRNAVAGQFVIPPQEGGTRIEALVFNETETTLIINPGNCIGTLEVLNIATEEDQTSHEGGSALKVPTVYKPAHIDASMTPAYATKGSAAFDLRADLPEIATIAPGERIPVPTGLRLAIPVGYEGPVRPRSGNALKYGITMPNSPGTIDSDYRGEIVAIVQNTGREPFEIAPDDRIAQFLIAPVVRASLDLRDELDDTERGQGGFGSTGRN